MIKRSILPCGLLLVAAVQPLYGESTTPREDHNRGWATYLTAGALTGSAVFLKFLAANQSQGDVHRTTPGFFTPSFAPQSPNADTWDGHVDNDNNNGNEDNPEMPHLHSSGDDDNVTTTPEPGTLSLLAGGLAGLAMADRRRLRDRLKRFGKR